MKFLMTPPPLFIIKDNLAASGNSCRYLLPLPICKARFNVTTQVRSFFSRHAVSM